MYKYTNVRFNQHLLIEKIFPNFRQIQQIYHFPLLHIYATIFYQWNIRNLNVTLKEVFSMNALKYDPYRSTMSHNGNRFMVQMELYYIKYKNVSYFHVLYSMNWSRYKKFYTWVVVVTNLVVRLNNYSLFKYLLLKLFCPKLIMLT